MVVIDLSQIAVDALSKIAIERNLPIRPIVDKCEGIPMVLILMQSIPICFQHEIQRGQVKVPIVEVNRVLKNDGLNLFSVRSDHDAMYRRGALVEEDI